MKHQCKVEVGKKNTKCSTKWIRKGLGLQLGGLWDGLGRLFGTFGRFFGVFWLFQMQLFSNMGQHGLKMGSQRPLASILGRFWKGWDRVLKGFGEVLGALSKVFYVRTPALSREAPRSVPMRGGPRPNACWTFIHIILA